MDNHLFSIGNFAKISGVKKATLFHYNEIGLFKPEFTASNGYRYYSEDQIYTFETITALRELNMPLLEIKEFLECRDKKKNLDVLKSYQKSIEDELFKLENIERLLATTITTMEYQDEIELDKPVLYTLEEPEYYFIFEAEQRNGTIAKHLPIIRKYIQYCRKNYLNHNFNIGEIVLHQDIENNTFKKTYGSYRLERKMNSSSCYTKPAGTYISMSHQGVSELLPATYRKLKRYLEQEGYTIVGDAYEEDVSTILSEQNRENFILNISFQVEKNE